MSTIRERFEQVEYIFHETQAGIARRIGVTPQLISQVVNEKFGLSYLTAKAIETEFGVNAQWLMTGEGDMITKKDNAAKELNLIPELVTALKNYPGITNAINQIAKKMTLPDWEALNAFISRSDPSPVSDGEIPVQTSEDPS